MTTEPKSTGNDRGSATQFMFSKTGTGLLKEVKKKKISDADEAVRTAYPGMRCGDGFIEYSNRQLEGLSRFSAIVIGLDSVEEGDVPAEPSGADEGQVDVADLLDRLCRKASGWWGQLETGLFAGCLPSKSNPDSLELAREFQKRLLGKDAKSVTIGVASFPSLEFKTTEVIGNARKAYDHATFFGANSLAAFDDVSLNISGDKFYEEGDLVAAITEYKLALELETDNVNVHNSLGVCYGLQGHYDEAIAEFKAAMALDPAEHMALYNLGMVHLLIDQRESALEYFLEADKIDHDTYEVAFQIGKLYLESDDSEKSGPYLERAAKLAPQSSQVFRHLGDCYAADCKPEQAITAYKKAIKHNPHDAAALSALGRLFEDQGENPEIALIFLRESVSIAPENGLFHHRLGRHYSNQRRLDEALEEFEKAQNLGHDSADNIKAVKERKKVEE